MEEPLPGTSAETSTKDEPDPELIFINFSRNVDRLIAGGDYGFAVYKTRPEDITPRLIFEMSRQPTQKDYMTFVNDILLVESFPPIHKFAVVFGKIPETLYFYDAVLKDCTGLTHFTQKILSVKACTENNYDDLASYVRLIIHPAPPNFSLLMDLTGEEKPRLVYPESETEGLVAVQSICYLSHSKNVINAHNHPIGALRLNNQATLLATTSNVSTVIRVYDARTTECLVVFRRGVARSVIVHSMAFSADSRFLCFTSNTETVHIFKIEGPIPKELYFCYYLFRSVIVHSMAFSADSRFLCFTSNTETVHIFKIEGPIPKELRLEEEIALQFEARDRDALNPPGWYDYFEQTKRAVTDYLAPTRDFASAILPETANLNVASLKDVNNKLHVIVAISTRKYFVFVIKNEGGVATLIRNERLHSKVLI
ncbi:unnamed protein product [Cercopithifilaria johnstoni]|uniref:WD repeat domain phosphoinositide-interacting protein 2 n=1 Tax=Cercopithifilaria johnstoni TaxID=2874296 RepID=A0A8J2M9K4_9BILA|nr:unnamed protein product [Cercopithifilaria johnstoni]